MRRFRELGGGWVAAQFLLFACVFVLALIFRGTMGQVWRYCGVALLAAGSVIAILGARMHGRNLSPFPAPPPTIFTQNQRIRLVLAVVFELT